MLWWRANCPPQLLPVQNMNSVLRKIQRPRNWNLWDSRLCATRLNTDKRNRHRYWLGNRWGARLKKALEPAQKCAGNLDIEITVKVVHVTNALSNWPRVRAAHSEISSGLFVGKWTKTIPCLICLNEERAAAKSGKMKLSIAISSVWRLAVLAELVRLLWDSMNSRSPVFWLISFEIMPWAW